MNLILINLSVYSKLLHYSYSIILSLRVIPRRMASRSVEPNLKGSPGAYLDSDIQAKILSSYRYRQKVCQISVFKLLDQITANKPVLNLSCSFFVWEKLH
ncbi:unnamed protein product [Cuscuta epithymum]|uniref:Uncharacterized protein n=1 Tax=Cuscuta epithymum TaxID=186058 RepID=A0AAV0FTJ5_9ASTE|nr:unnamed protein product [Cuscuta epithymum]CAH9138989.1 unnamed protein product [Cuscuta epithymum]